MVAKSYVSKRPISRKIKEKIKEYTPKAKSAFFAGLAFAREHIQTTPIRKKKRKNTKINKTKRKKQYRR